jgi:hypothetical protein
VPHILPRTRSNGFVDEPATDTEVRRQPRDETDVVSHEGEVFLRGERGIGHVDELLRPVTRHDPRKLVKDLTVGLLVGRVAVENTPVAGEIALDAEKRDHELT